MGEPGQHLHVLESAAAEVHMRDHHQRDIVAERALVRFAGHGAETATRVAEQPLQALRHVAIGREVAFDGDHAVAAGLQRQSRGQQLEQVHGDRVAADHLTRRSADQRRDPFAAARRQVDPTMGVPAADEVAPPLGIDCPFYEH